MYSPWTNVEVQNRNLGTQLRIYLQNPFTNWSFQTTMFAYARNTTPLFQHKFSPTKLSYTSYCMLNQFNKNLQKIQFQILNLILLLLIDHQLFLLPFLSIILLIQVVNGHTLVSINTKLITHKSIRLSSYIP